MTHGAKKSEITHEDWNALVERLARTPNASTVHKFIFLYDGADPIAREGTPMEQRLFRAREKGEDVHAAGARLWSELLAGRATRARAATTRASQTCLDHSVARAEASA